MQNLDIETHKLDRAFDIMAKGGKLGSFELRNMARELPAVASRAKALGLVGEEGLTMIVAMLETTRRTAATGEEAANNLLNYFDKITSADTTKRFKDQGVDIERALKDGARNGVDYVTTMTDLVEKMTHGDPFKIAKLFPDRQAREGIMALIKFKEFYKSAAREINETAFGANQRDLQRQLDTTKSKVDRMSSAWDVFVGKVGETIAPVVTPVLEGATQALTALGAPSQAPAPPSRGEVERLRVTSADLDRRRQEEERAQTAFTKGGGGSWYGTFGLWGTDKLGDDLDQTGRALREAEAAKKKLDEIERAAAARASMGLELGMGPSLGGLPLPPSMRQDVVGAPGVVAGELHDRPELSRLRRHERLPKALAPGAPQPVRIEGAADIGFTIKVEAPELLKVYEASRTIVARGALRADTGVSMSEAAPRGAAR